MSYTKYNTTEIDEVIALVNTLKKNPSDIFLIEPLHDEEAQNVLNTLNKCKCCKRHMTNRNNIYEPLHYYGKWTLVGENKADKKSSFKHKCKCKCKCRQTTRDIKRTHPNSKCL